MTTRAAVAIPKAGLVNTTYNTATSADRVPPGSILHIKNASGSSCNVTIVTLDDADGDLVIADRAITVIPATTGMAFVAIPRAWPYLDTSDGLVGIAFDQTTSVTYAVISAP